MRWSARVCWEGAGKKGTLPKKESQPPSLGTPPLTNMVTLEDGSVQAVRTQRNAS